MSYLNILRQLSDQQQYQVLYREAQNYWQDTQDKHVLPILALSQLHSHARHEAELTLQSLKHVEDELDVDAKVDLAAVYILTQQMDAAFELLQRQLQIDPNHALAMARLAFCYSYRDQLKNAYDLYEKSLEIEPTRLTLYTNLVSLCLYQKNEKSAQNWLDKGVLCFEQEYPHLPENVIASYTSQLRQLQLEIWVNIEAFAEAEDWLEQKRVRLDEADWCPLLGYYAELLSKKDLHDQATEILKTGLKQLPESLEFMSQLSEIAQVQGRNMQAIQLLRRCIKIAKRDDKPEISLWIRLSNVCLHNLEEQARKAAEKAVELVQVLEENDSTTILMIKQLSWQAKNALANVESQAQNFEQAERLFNEVLEENPYFLPALQGLGQQQMQRGRIDDAIALFERVKEIDPAKGYASLINARRFPDDDKTLEQIEKMARQPSIEGEVSSSLLLQLATAWEKRKDYDKAFALAVEANDSSKKKLNYDSQSHRQNCARIRHAFSQALYEYRPDCGYRGEDASLPVFVLGMPRSGTTLVEQILASHSQIFGAGELGVIPQRIQGLNRWERHTGSGRKYPDCVDDLNPYTVEGLAKGILDELKALAAEDKPNALHVVDKLPHNFENVGLIKFLFPQAKIISVRRDPRDIAMSNYFTNYQAKHGGMGFAYDLTWIGEQLADHNLLMHHWQQIFPGEILEVQYEEVIEAPEFVARKMLDYIGVDWEEQVLSFNELDRPVKTASVWQVRQPIYKTSKAKWMRYEKHLAPLIHGTNAKIQPDPITDMVTFPVPGMFVDGVEDFKKQRLDDAEMNFKKVLHHFPEHAAANFMLGLIYCSKNYLTDGIALMEKGLKICPWNKNWRSDLLKAYDLAGEVDKKAALESKYPNMPALKPAEFSTEESDELDFEGQWNATEYV